MAKDFKKGSKCLINYNSGTRNSPTWNNVKAVISPGCNPNPDDIEVEEQGVAKGHLHGEHDPEITFTLEEDAGDSNIETLIAALYSGAMVELAYSNGPMATAGTKYVRMECALFAPQTGDRGSVSKYDVTAKRHGNSDYEMTRHTVSA